MRDFICEIRSPRVVFGMGAINKVAYEVEALGVKKLLLITTPSQNEQAKKISQQLMGCEVKVFDRSVMHVPVEIVDNAYQVLLEHKADGLIALGGGSAIGLAKALAVRSDLPILAIPSTYSGSEMTAVYGTSHMGLKTTSRSANAMAKVVLYDPELTFSLPYELSVTSGINSIAHAAEGLYAQNGNPILNFLAEEAIRSMVKGLRSLRDAKSLNNARFDCLYGAWLSGVVLENAGMALHHKLCHTLGGSFNLDHAATHSVILPHSMAYNSSTAPEAMQSIRRALNVSSQSAQEGLYDLLKELNAPYSLAAIGMQEKCLSEAARLTVLNTYWNPSPIDYESVLDLLKNAFDGVKPS